MIAWQITSKNEITKTNVTENLEHNNFAKEQSLYFDLVVKAIQVTEAP